MFWFPAGGGEMPFALLNLLYLGLELTDGLLLFTEQLLSLPFALPSLL